MKTRAASWESRAAGQLRSLPLGMPVYDLIQLLWNDVLPGWSEQPEEVRAGYAEWVWSQADRAFGLSPGGAAGPGRIHAPCWHPSSGQVRVRVPLREDGSENDSTVSVLGEALWACGLLRLRHLPFLIRPTGTSITYDGAFRGWVWEDWEWSQEGPRRMLAVLRLASDPWPQTLSLPPLEAQKAWRRACWEAGLNFWAPGAWTSKDGAVRISARMALDPPVELSAEEARRFVWNPPFPSEESLKSWGLVSGQDIVWDPQRLVRLEASSEAEAPWQAVWSFRESS